MMKKYAALAVALLAVAVPAAAQASAHVRNSDLVQSPKAALTKDGRPSYTPALRPGAWKAAPSFFTQSLLGKLDLRPSGVNSAVRGSWWGGPTVASTGETVTVYVSDIFVHNDSYRTSWANFFASLYHGSELSTLTVYQTTLGGVHASCGPNAAACYFPSTRNLVMPVDIEPGIAMDIAAHEYGHHIAASRRNDPWNAGDWGPKRWATTVGVCSRAAAGTAFPGDEGAHYTLNTGEAFAETNRILNVQRGGGWANLALIVDPSFAPTTASLDAARTDIQSPWAGPTTPAWDGRFVSPTTRANAAVGPGGTISLTFAPTAPLEAGQAGTYAITVRDRSVRDNFHLIGPAGLNLRTGVAGRSRVVWKLDLKPGVYHYRSDAHPSLRKSFTITTPTTATFPPQEETISTPLDGTFQAAVNGASGTTLEILDPASGQDLVPPSSGPISFTICGQRSVLLRVAAVRAGQFHVAITTP